MDVAGLEAVRFEDAQELSHVQVEFVPGAHIPSGERLAQMPAVSVPVTLRRRALSELLNRLLQQTPALPYDFLLDEKLVRGTLVQHMQSQGISSETVLRLVYVHAFGMARQQAAQTHPDWVGSMHAFSAVKSLATGCYDGIARVWNTENWSVIEARGHTKPVKTVRLGGSKGQYLFTGSMDHSLRLFHNQQNQMQCIAVKNHAHSDTVEAVDIMWPGNSDDLKTCRVASASWDQKITIWSLEECDRDTEEGSSKRARTVDNQTEKASHKFDSVCSLHGHHTQVVSSLHWAAPMALYSGSWDHTICQWDVTQSAGYQDPVRSWNTPAAVSSVAFSERKGMLAAGHSDRKVRLYDPRSDSGKIVQLELDAHKGGWVSGVAWCPQNVYHLVSAGYDGAVKVWDIRSAIPLSSSAPVTSGEADTFLCVDWASDGTIYAGGQQGELRSFSASIKVVE